MYTPTPDPAGTQPPLDRRLIIALAQMAGFDVHDMSADFTCNLSDIERFFRAAHAVGVGDGRLRAQGTASGVEPCAYPSEAELNPVAEVTVSHVRPDLDGQYTAEIAGQERLPVGAELFLHPPQVMDHQAFVDAACARIQAADDAAADHDYMLDSNDCIQVLRGQWKSPLRNDYPKKPDPTHACQAPEQGELVAWQQRRARRVSNGVVTEWSPWYPVTTHNLQQAQQEAPEHVPHQWRPLYTGPVEGVDPGQHEVLRQAAEQALAAMDYMLRNGEWFRAQERADALREALKAGPVPLPSAKH